ncbi:hypothetical protein RI129_012356 [Pyrocoelia pectoralis]|uniref:Codanin-1 C-terminal domain-containing protein n=1 Tax=Pyrocoelia pectoralis TaxID=417401 RepID=A0AAN7ZES2_9COLE
MCEKLLSQIVDNIIPLNAVVEWIKNPNIQKENIEQITQYNCSQIEFILFFLNYVHEISNRPPKLVENVVRNVEQTPPRRRSSLLENNNLSDNFDTYTSPLYKQQPFAKKLPSPKTPPTVCLGDFIVRKETRRKIQKNLNESFSGGARRINPTNISRPSFPDTKNSFTFDKNDENLNCTDRKNLLEERSRITFEGTETIAKVINKKVVDVPVFNRVTFPEKLDILIDLYVFLLNNCYVVNLTSEIHFVVSVLLKKQCDGDVTPKTSLEILLNSLSDQVYFAVGVLQKQTDFLNSLDKLTVRLLFDNARLRHFAKDNYCVNFLKAYECKLEKPLSVRRINKSVYFECETDNRNNFSSNGSFHNFRKQRDLFYEILQIWENNRLVNNWSFASALGQKIRYLVNLDSEPNNFVHFAKLFKAQLIVNTCQDGTIGDEDTIKSVIPNIDEEKLSKLNTRIGKKNCAGINLIPTFANYEEFYKDFVLIAASPSFSKHFVDVIAAEIVEVNNFPVDFLDTDEFDTFGDSVRLKFVTKVKTLRILAKFLGFFETLPYRSNCTQLPEIVVSDQLEIRNKIKLILDLKEILLEAVKKKSLTLTLPWLVKYLAMLDSVTLKVSQIQEIFRILFKIHFDGSSYPILVKLCLGWLFELPHIPNGLYYVWMSHNKDHVPVVPKSFSRNLHLDDLQIFGSEILYTCCPYLDAIKRIITDNANAFDRSVTCKHITPLTAINSVCETPNTKLQSQLEDMFFCTQPDSVKRTVEFVSERVASGCIKEICYEIVPLHKKDGMSKLQSEVDIGSPEIEDLSQKYADSSLTNLLNIIKSTTESNLNSRITVAMEALLPSTVLKQTKDLCVFLTHRMCTNRVDQWVKSHVTQG